MSNIELNNKDFKTILKENQQQLIDRILDPAFWGKEGKEMKFNAVVGNPPYHVSDGGVLASASPVYNYFVDVARQLNPNFISMIIPSRWMAGGKGLDEFRKSMLSDKRISILHDFPNCKECFTDVNIKGGVCFFLWNRDNDSPRSIYKHNYSEVTESCRYLKEGDLNVFIREGKLVDIYHKVKAIGENSFSDIVSPLKPYGLRSDVFKDPSKYNLPLMSETKFDDCITVYGLDEHLERVKKYISRDYPLPKKDLMYGYKIFVAKSQGRGIFGETYSNPIFGGPDDVCTETYVVFGPFNTEKESYNCWEYLKTKFFRALLGIRKIDQGAACGVYKYIPMQDFTKIWTDQELYEKYNLSNQEIEFIEKNVQKMD